jgi:hypothetical protein
MLRVRCYSLMVPTRVKDLLPLSVRPSPYLRRTARAKGGHRTTEQQIHIKCGHQTHFLSLASHLRPTSSHPKTPSLLRKAGGSGFQAISHTTMALASPTTCRLFLRHMEQTIRSKCFPPKYAVKIPPLLNSSNRSLSFGGTRD